MSENTALFSFVWFGIAFRGLDGDTPVSASFTDDGAVIQKGLRKGESSVVSSISEAGTVTVKLQANSVSIPEILAIQKDIDNGLIATPTFSYKKIVGNNSYLYTGNASIVKMPDLSSTDSGSVIELIFISANMELVTYAN